MRVVFEIYLKRTYCRFSLPYFSKTGRKHIQWERRLMSVSHNTLAQLHWKYLCKFLSFMDDYNQNCCTFPVPQCAQLFVNHKWDYDNRVYTGAGVVLKYDAETFTHHFKHLKIQRTKKGILNTKTKDYTKLKYIIFTFHVL